MTMTPSRLAEIKAAAEAATPGPWGIEMCGDHVEHVRAFEKHPEWCENDPATCPHGKGILTTDCNVYTSDDDARFIALARTAVGELIEEIERLQRENEELRNARR